MQFAPGVPPHLLHAHETRGRRVLGVASGAVLAYLALAATERAAGIDLPDFAVVAVPFLLLPLTAFWAMGERPEVGRPDRALLLSAAAYAPFAAWAALAVAGAPWFAASLAHAVSGPLLALGWAAATFVHVGAVDYFTRRVVQHEAERRWGVSRGLWVGVGAWTVGHVLEWLWLRELMGPFEAALFLVAAGVATGLAYVRWRNVLGLMVGHFLVNVVVAIVAVSM